ncbi:MAG: hypothetical protein ABIR80_19935 [Opitutaceae bacterium]
MTPSRHESRVSGKFAFPRWGQSVLVAGLVFLAPSADGAFAAETTADARASLFAYDRTADFAIQEKSATTRDDATVRDLTFFSVPGEKFGRIAAYIVAPRRGSARATILWVHWLGEPATTNRTEFLDEAVALASRGVVSLLVDSMWAKPNWYRDRVLDLDLKGGLAQVAALRRALDLLQQRPGAARLALAIVGHDYGGMYATVAAAQEPRAKTCVFIACTPSLLDWAFFTQKPASMDDYVRENAPLDLRPHLAAIRDASMLFQFAEQDRYVPLAKAQEFFAVAPNPKQMIVYGGAGHDMTKPAAIRQDRTAWLIRELGL